MSQASDTARTPLVLWSVAAMVILGAVIMGLIVTGGPQVQRAKKMDRERVSDLSTIRHHIQNYINDEKKLPENFLDLKAKTKDSQWFPVDPATRESYGYHKKDDAHFALCAVFQLDNRHTDEAERVEEAIPEEKNYLHPKGKHCYQYYVKETGDDQKRQFTIE